MSKLTKWEVGQDLILISDYIAEKLEDIQDSISDVDFIAIQNARAIIGNVFNRNNDHGFGIFDSSDLDEN